MKFIVKLPDSRKIPITTENTTYGDLKSRVLILISSECNQEVKSIELSLNGKQPIEANDEELLSDVGIVSGDLLFVIYSNSNCPDKTKDNSRSNIDADFKQPLTKKCSLSSNENEIDSNDQQEMKDLFDQYSPSSPSEVVVILSHSLLLKNGYKLDGGSSVLPPTWRNMVTSFNYCNASFSNFTITVTFVSMGDTKQILVSFPKQTSEISIKINVNDYVLPENVHYNKLKKIKQFNSIFQIELLHSVQKAAHEIMGIPAPWDLSGLPQEIIIHIACFLKLKDIHNLSSTSKRLYSAMADSKIWFSLFKKDFPKYSHDSDTLLGSDWRAKYKSIYIQQKNEEKSGGKHTFVIPEYREPTRGVRPHHPYAPQPPFPFGMPDPNPINPFRDPDSPYFQDLVPPGVPRYPINPYIVPGAQRNRDPFKRYGFPGGGSGAGPFI